MKCPEKWCQSEDIRYKPASTTKGFHPDFECRKCGFRWIETKGFGLRDLHEAVKETRSMIGGENSLTRPKRTGRATP